MMSLEEKIKEVEMFIVDDSNYQSGLYRKIKGEMLPGSNKYKANGEDWEGNIFAGKDVVAAVKDGWWDCFEEAPNSSEKEKNSASSGAVTMDKKNL